MTDGLKVAAGEALRAILAGWTATLARGVVAGVLITALAQSSSAVIFAIIGFVNAGLLTLTQALGVIYGSNLGTTVTSWLVALLGFKVNLQALALPAIAAGMGLRVAGRGARSGALGEALAGFGVFFLGIDVLKGAFEGMGESLAFEAMSGEGRLAQLGFVLLGVLLTVAMQSSSAALAVALTAAGSGFIPLGAAAAVVIGANVGTTSTAAFAVIGATPSAKRAAFAHVLFNALTGVAAYLLLPALLWLVQAIMQAFVLAPAPATALALFHTLTKLLGLALLWPATSPLVRFLESRFRTAEEDEAQPRHLDHNILGTPALALDALTMELARIGGIARRMAKAALSAEAPRTARLVQDKRVADRLVMAVGDFTNKLHHADLPHDLAEAFPHALRVSQYLADITERALDIAELQPALTPPAEAELGEALTRFKAAAARQLDAADPDTEGFSLERLEQTAAALENDYQALKGRLLRAGTEGRLPIRQMVARLDELSAIRRMLDQALKAARYSASLHAAVTPHREPPGGDHRANPSG
jgi:phosphate:Na+ symporter